MQGMELQFGNLLSMNNIQSINKSKTKLVNKKFVDGLSYDKFYRQFFLRDSNADSKNKIYIDLLYCKMTESNVHDI